ncbi:hypothetical protein MPH_08268 [Macrophomina phaseolina MS6]|uniref:Uncharacterized protein n=1 Tax=Macrophomina phaseolina (strain MS6) TaxID=1126212 RepID=K2RP79_MACPH|nr:hypothetical protein MPH_08268 [Macrophomina phaseolina MS6]
MLFEAPGKVPILGREVDSLRINLGHEKRSAGAHRIHRRLSKEMVQVCGKRFRGNSSHIRRLGSPPLPLLRQFGGWFNIPRRSAPARIRSEFARTPQPHRAQPLVGLATKREPLKAIPSLLYPFFPVLDGRPSFKMARLSLHGIKHE